MKTLHLGSFILSAAASVAAFAAQSPKNSSLEIIERAPTDVVTLEQLIAAPPAHSHRIKVGMDQNEVVKCLGAPDVMFARNLWAYVNVTLHGLAPGENYDALVVFIVDGRVRMVRRTRKSAVLATKLRLDQAAKQAEVVASGPR